MHNKIILIDNPGPSEIAIVDVKVKLIILKVNVRRRNILKISIKVLLSSGACLTIS